MTSRMRVVALALLVAVSLFVPANVAQACSEKCKREVDRNYCDASGGFLAGRNCQEWQECSTQWIDADGAGPGSPQLYVVCQYKCAVELCNWV